jgi:hypothetical protein
MQRIEHSIGQTGKNVNKKFAVGVSEKRSSADPLLQTSPELPAIDLYGLYQ